MKHVLRYVKGTTNYGISYTTGGNDVITGYCDADWAGDISDRKSTSGYMFILAGGPVSWKSKKQTCVSLSTAEAEYVALASASQEAIWIGKLLDQLGERITFVTILDDSQSAIAMTKNVQYHGRAKHIDIKYHFIRQQIEAKTVKLQYCPTSEMIADILTKGLSREQHNKLMKLMKMKLFKQ